MARLFGGISVRGVMPVEGLRWPDDQMLLDTIVKLSPINTERPIHHRQREINVFLGMGIAQDERWHEDAAPNRLLQKQRSESLGRLSILVDSRRPIGSHTNTP
jgi:hypothetical protein